MANPYLPAPSVGAPAPAAGQLLPMFSTFVNPSAAQRVCNVLASTYLSEGKLVQEFEARLSAELGMRHPAALNSGTSALHLALEVAGIGAGDEVILAPQTFIASALTVVQVGARPVFADIQYDTGNIDPADIEHRITPRTKAIMAVHWGGYPCDLAEIQAIADRHGLVVIEDAAHSPGASYRGQAIGAISDFTCFSFQAIKHLTTGEEAGVRSDQDFSSASVIGPSLVVITIDTVSAGTASAAGDTLGATGAGICAEAETAKRSASDAPISVEVIAKATAPRPRCQPRTAAGNDAKLRAPNYCLGLHARAQCVSVGR